jgi:type IV pilus assembly protein PilY1
MKRNRAINFVFAALTGIVAGLPITIHADDTEIYVGNRAFSAGVRPNVLLVLDTSGSMAARDGLTLDRLDRVKVALNAILDDVNDMNIGLARFHTPGGPILFPIAYVDDDAQDVEHGLIPEINQRLLGSANDAEQLGVGSATVLDSPQLELTKTASFGGESSNISTVAVSSDDAQESLGGVVDTTRAVMDCCSFTNGLRFAGVPIPKGAPILSARIVFVASTPSSVPTSMTFYGEKAPVSKPFDSTDPKNITNRTPTTATVTWKNVPEWAAAGDRMQSANLQSIVQEIVNENSWVAGKALTIIFKGIGNRQVRTVDSAITDAAQLVVEYGVPGSATGKQLIGLRFADVRVPQKQGIKSAVLEFVPVADAVNAVQLEIHGQASDDSAAFTTAVNDISSRPGTLSKVKWNAAAAEWKDGVAQTSPDLSAVVQEIVNRPGWCGGNAMTFGIDDLGADGPRIAASFDGDPSLAPILRIDFDTTRPPGPGEGCTIQEVTARPSLDVDDVNQNISDQAMNSPSTILQMDNDKQVGLRFANLQVPPGVTITDARLVFNASDPGVNSAKPTDLPVAITISAEAASSAGLFVSGFGNDVITRTRVPDSVVWNPPVWTVGTNHTSPDLSQVIDAVVNGVPGWASGNNLAILLNSGPGGSRIATSHDTSPGDAPQLRITMRAKIGDLPNIPVTTVRQRLKQVVNELDHQGATPIVDILQEAAAYFRGEAVKWGLDRGTSGDSVRRTTRVSHPASYTGGTVVRDPGCTDANLNDQACVTEHITGSPKYISPITTECQANFIVLLTDGLANRNSSKSLIQNTTGVSTCSTTLPAPPNGSGGAVSSSEECGLELSAFLNDTANDQNPAVAGPNVITTYTIGLNITNEWIEQLAKVGGGTFSEAGSTQQLRKTFNDITSDILQRTTSFATPSVSVNAFNRLFNQDDVYFSLFEPQHNVAWPGNIKKYRLCTDPLTCPAGGLVDMNGNAALDANNRIDSNAQSFWLDPDPLQRPDGANVLWGGAGNTLAPTALLPRHIDRRVLTFTGPGTAPGTTVPVGGTDLANDGHQVADIDSDGILDGLKIGTADDKLQQTKDLLGWPGNPVSTLTATERADLVIELHNHIQWIRGQDVDDEDIDGNTVEDRYSFYDPLHSSAVAFTIGGTTLEPVVKVVVGTNDGGVRLVNGQNGAEELIFYPQSTLRRLGTLRTNPAGGHLYGIDGTPTLWLNDVNKNGFIEQALGDFVRLFIGQRRGGNEIYALELTPKNTADLSDQEATDSIDPYYHWRIQGGSAEYPRLGQTWSRPKLSTIVLANEPNIGDQKSTTALLFAGGYDDAQDNGFGPGGLGNAIYITDPITGKRWLSVSTTDPGGPAPNDVVVVTDDPLVPIDTEPKMTFPIPSDLALLDASGDGNTDRILVGDTGGQLWRVDLLPVDPAINTVNRLEAVVGRLGMVSSDQTLADLRKFFEPPDVVQVRRSLGFSSVANYDLVTIVSGNRANPLNPTTQDRFYAFRDTVIGQLKDDLLPFTGMGDGIADNFTTLQGALDSPFTPGDLFDVTNVVDPQGTDLTKLQNANGYYFNLVDPGEKGLSSPVTLAGTVFFTTYLPAQVVNVSACTLVEGSGVLYGINVLNGASVFNWDQSPVSDPLSIQDRRYALGSGIPSAAVPIFTPDGVPLLIGGSGGATILDLGIALPRTRTFWFDERGL